MIKLHYAPLVLDGDIPCYEFGCAESFYSFLGETVTRGVVYLAAVEGKRTNEIYVGERTSDIVSFLERYTINPVKVYFQEYASYEEAYKVALDMKEESPLCYEPEQPE